MSSNGFGKDKWANSIRFAALYTLQFSVPLNKEVENQARLLFALEGDELRKLNLIERLKKLQPLYQMGMLGWNPEDDLFIYTATGNADSFDKSYEIGPNKLISRTVSFSDQLARPMAVVTMTCLVVPFSPNQWYLRSMTLYGVSDDSCDIDRPILISPQGHVMVAPQS